MENSGKPFQRRYRYLTKNSMVFRFVKQLSNRLSAPEATAGGQAQ